MADTTVTLLKVLSTQSMHYMTDKAIMNRQSNKENLTLGKLIWMQ